MFICELWVGKNKNDRRKNMSRRFLTYNKDNKPISVDDEGMIIDNTLIVTVSKVDDTFVADKTFNEILKEIQRNKNVKVKFVNDETLWNYYQLSQVNLVGNGMLTFINTKSSQISKLVINGLNGIVTSQYELS